MAQQKYIINYDKLREICQRAKEDRLDHDEFMREYPLLFQNPSTPLALCNGDDTTPLRPRSMTADSPKQSISLRQMRSRNKTTERVQTISAGEKSSDPHIMEQLLLMRKLKTIANIALICPPLRAEEDTKKLASLLSDFPALLPPDTPYLVRQRIAARVMADKVLDRTGMSLPREGGLYLILQGRVQETHKNVQTGEYTTTILCHGQVFGEMKEPAYPPKLSYPTYLGEKKCVALRITLTDIQRSKEIVKESEMDDHLQFLDTSPLLKTFPIHIRQKLAVNIRWKNIPTATKVLIEGEPVLFLSIIKEGKCRVTKSASSNLLFEKVCIGEVREGTCIGELAIEGCEIAPYTITALTPLTVGEISIETIRALELQNLITVHQQYTITLPSEEEMQRLFAEKQMRKQWSSLKKAIIGQVYRERQGERLKNSIT